MPMVWNVPKGKASLERSAAVTVERMERDAGPIRVSTEYAEVTSNSWALAPDGMLRRIQSKSCEAKPVPVTM